MKFKLIILFALTALLSACESTDEHGVTVSKRSIFSANEIANINFNS